MQRVANLILIGGSGRNVGKTTFACLLIGELSKKNKVIAIKISNIKPDDNSFHGFHEKSIEGNYEIFEEIGLGDKDSQRMLAAGASRSFFVRTTDNFGEEAFGSLIKQIDENSLLVCESNSLRKFVEPRAFVMVGNKKDSNKYSAKANFEKADFIVRAMDLDGFGKVVGILGKQGIIT
jgi:hypothetical protein